MHYHLHKTSLRRGGSYIGSPEWLKNKRVTINIKNNDDNCFQHAIIAALDYDKIENHPERISNIKPFINQYNWKDIDFLSHQKDWKNFEQNNKAIALNISYVPYNTKEIRVTYKSEYNFKRKNQVILLMITDGKAQQRCQKWHYLAVKNLSRLFIGITSNHNGDFYCLNCFIHTAQKKDLKDMKEYVMIMIIVT